MLARRTPASTSRDRSNTKSPVGRDASRDPATRRARAASRDAMGDGWDGKRGVARARALAVLAVAVACATLGAREMVESRALGRFVLPRGYVWESPALRERGREEIRGKVERWARLGVKVTVTEGTAEEREMSDITTDEGGARGDNASEATAMSIEEQESGSKDTTAMTPEEEFAIGMQSTGCIQKCGDDLQIRKVLDGRGCDAVNGNGDGTRTKLKCLEERCDCAESTAIYDTLLFVCDARDSGSNFSYVDMMDFYDASVETAFDDCTSVKENKMVENQLNAPWDEDAKKEILSTEITPIASNASGVPALGAWCDLPGDAAYPALCAIPHLDNPSCSFNSGCGGWCPWGSVTTGVWHCGWCCGWCWSWPCWCWCSCSWRRWGVRCSCGCHWCTACASLPTFEQSCWRVKLLRVTGGCVQCIPGYEWRDGRCQLMGWIQDIANGIQQAAKTIAEAPGYVARAANDVKSAFDSIGDKIREIASKAEDLANNFAKKVTDLFEAIANSIIPTSPEAVVRGIEKAFICGSNSADLGVEPEHIIQPVYMGLLDPLNHDALDGMIKAVMRGEDIRGHNWTTHRRVRNPHYSKSANLGDKESADLGWCPPSFSPPEWPDFPDINVDWSGIPWPPKTPTIPMPRFPSVKLPRMPGLTFPGLPGWSPVCLLTQVCIAPKVELSFEKNRGMELDLSKKLHGTGTATAGFSMEMDTKYPISVCIRVKKVRIPFEVISQSIEVIVNWVKKKLFVAFDVITSWGQPIVDAIDDAKDTVKQGIDTINGWFNSIGIGRRLLESGDVETLDEANEEIAYRNRLASELESRQLALAARYLGRLEAAYATYAPEMESHIRLQTERMRSTVKSHPVFHSGKHHDAAALGLGILDFADSELTDGLLNAFRQMKKAAFIIAVGAAFDTKVTVKAEASTFMTGDFTDGGITRQISQTFGGGSGFYTTLEGTVRVTAPWMFYAEAKGEFSYRVYHEGDIGFEIGLDDGTAHIKVSGDPGVKAEPTGAFSAAASFKTGFVFEIVDMKLQFCYDTKVCAGPQINVAQPIYLGADAYVAAAMAGTKCFAGGTELTAVFAETFEGYKDNDNCRLRSGGTVAGVGGYVELPYPSVDIVLQTIVDGNEKCVPDFQVYNRPTSGNVLRDNGKADSFQTCSSTGSGNFINEAECPCPKPGEC